VLVALAALLGAGLLLRVYFLLVWRPALTGFSDTGVYFQGAVASLWSSPGRTAGYSMFLRVLHAISPHLILVTIVQHGLGLLAAVLFFLAVRRCGGPRGLGLAPAAIIALGGDELFIEHAALSEAVFIFLLSAMLYCAVRASQDGVWWAALAGLCAGLGVWDRVAGVEMVAVIALWLVFKPPPGTRPLCEPTPPSQRHDHSNADYIFQYSPAQQLLGPSYLVSKYPHAMALLQKWSEAVILNQPLDYLHAVSLDAIRLVDPNHFSYGAYSADELVAYLLYGPEMHPPEVNKLVTSWQRLLYPDDPAAHHGDIGPLKEWERITRIDGVWMVILLALCLTGPWLVAGRARAGTTLFAATALVLLFFPILTTGYDYRYTIPAFGPLLAAGALASWGLVVRVTARVRTARA